MLGLFALGCAPGALFAPPPSPTPTARPRARVATATPTLEDTATPTDEPATATATTEATAAPPTATWTSPPAATATRRPPAATFTPRPPTPTFTPAPPTSTPTPAFALTLNWINPGRPYDANECNSFPNGTHLQGMVRHSDGSIITGAIRTGWMHMWIKGMDSGPFARPGVAKDFPNWNDGRWDAEFPKWPKDFEWHIDITAKNSDDVISADLTATASASSACGQPGTRNFYVVDWISH